MFSKERKNNKNDQQSTTKKFYYYKGIIIKKNITKFLNTLVMKIIPKEITIQSSTKYYSATHYHYQASTNFTIQKLQITTTYNKQQLEMIHNPKNDIDYLHDIHMNPNLYYSNYLQQVYKSSTLFLI